MATIDLLARRREMMAQGEEDYYAGWTMNAAFRGGSTNGDDIISSETTCLSPYFAIPIGCAKVRYRNGADGVANVKQVQTDDNHDITAQQTYGHGYSSSWSITSGTTMIRMTCYMEDLDDCYLYDLTNQAYLWKGKNVT